MRRGDALLIALAALLVVGGVLGGLWAGGSTLSLFSSPAPVASAPGSSSGQSEAAASGQASSERTASQSGLREPSVTAAAIDDARRSVAQLREIREQLDGSGEAASEGQQTAETERRADAADPLAPKFDFVRAAGDGSAVIAGRAQPGALVTVTINGQPVDEVRADARGEFVSIVDPVSDGRVTVNLSTIGTDGLERTAREPLLLSAPDTGPVAPLLPPDSERGQFLRSIPAVESDEVTIDALSYGQGGSVVVGGRGAPGSVARVFLDDALEAEARVAPDGVWEVTMLQEIEPSVYTLRVDQMQSDGAVGSRAETPFERVAVEDISFEEGTVVIQPGNTLWKIAVALYGDGAQYPTIFRENRDKIRDPNLIFPGQIFRLPDVAAGGQTPVGRPSQGG
ncbi:MAG: LysM peptidoglycan-binding domain-containing protein [Pseudomonadota bacterium]